MLRNPEAWPGWPLLPIKKYVEQDMKCGLVFYADAKPTVYLGNLFALETGPVGPQLIKLERVTYDTWEQAVADGWEVD